MAPPFAKILIANRGEIACRIIRTARRMGIATVAVYSDADSRALHVRMADEAMRIGPAAAAESYLDGAAIIAAAKATSARAIHPGYGFLSENPDFAEAVAAAGLVFIGPKPDAIRAMGLKDAAKQRMERAGVPVVPGYHGDAQDFVLLAGKAKEIGYPVLVKARAGGGGKGMRKVDHPDDFRESLAACRREAKAAFGDDHVLVEKYIGTPRHIEVQVFGDSHDNVVHLFERDCSLQRRHQKVIEEAPAPGMTEAVRKAMTDAAVKAAKAIGYEGAGTVEFIVDGSGAPRPDGFWFMEMNTRLQVEHPVTEAITGIDLVEWQIRAAAGERLPRTQSEIELCGHAVEARLYAEDAARDFLPATGTLHHLAFPDALSGGALLRVDSGVAQGDAISPWYDPMIAKVIVQAQTREAALESLTQALRGTRIAGTVTNLGFLARLAEQDDFVVGAIDTGLIGRHQNALSETAVPEAGDIARAALAASGMSAPAGSDPWTMLSGYGHFTPLARRVTLHDGGAAIEATVSAAADGKALVKVGDEAPISLPLVGRAGPRGATILVGGQYEDAFTPTPSLRPDPPHEGEGYATAVLWPGHVTVFRDGNAFTFAAPDPFAEAEAHVSGDSLRAPMPGVVKIVRAAAGDSVTKGQPLLVLEAMKMEHSIAAPHDGIVADIAAEGAQVSEGTVLARFAELE
jgi:3-methylcrotonyl-CoA carboxylase alpha subunit